MEAELQFLWIALISYVLAGSLAIGSGLLGRLMPGFFLMLIGTGVVSHGISLSLRWIRLGHGPFVNLFEILSSNIWSLLLIYSIAYARLPNLRATGAIVMPVIFMMMGWLILTHPGDSTLPPTYDTLWLYIHVGFGKVFLGAVLIAVGLSGVILIRGLRPTAFANLPITPHLDELSYRCLALGWIFDTLMLIAGAIWAQDAWGRYWDWDPLETWTLITWLLTAAALHLRPTFQTGPRLNSILVLVVFLVAFLTFFGIPFLSRAPHQGMI